MKEKWTMVITNKLVSGEKVNSLKAANIIKNVERRSYEDLQKVADAAFEEKVARENDLIQAFEDKKLKSKALIKEAKALKKAKEKANKEKESAEMA